MKGILLLITLSLSVVGLAFAKASETEVSGTVIDQEGQAIAGASVYLMSSGSQIIIKTAVTDADGRYRIEEAPRGTYYIEVSSVGSERGQSEVFEVDTQEVVVAAIVLTPATEEISEVLVERQLPLIQQRQGKMIMDVENSSLAAGNNALDVVKRAPGVNVDNDDNIQLMGQGGVNVTIDGRQTYMTGEQLATFLKSTDASQIKSIEVSTSRTAKEDAEGASGTINIVLKKNKLEGFNGTFNATAAQGKRFRGNSSIALNYKKDNTMYFGSYAYDDTQWLGSLDMERNITNNNETTAFDQYSQIYSHNKSHNYRLGIEQRTSDRNILTVQFSGNNRTELNDNLSDSYIGPTVGLVDSILHSNSDYKESFRRHSFNFNNEFQIDTIGKKLTLDLDWSRFRTTRNVNYNNAMYDPDYNELYTPELQRSHMPTAIDIYVGKIDYTQPLGSTGNIEAGLKYSNVRSDNDLVFEEMLNGDWKNHEGRTNHFVYNEQIAAAYVDYSVELDKWGLKAGLRSEYTLSDGNSITLNNRVKRDYVDVFPSASLSYNLHEDHILSLSYSKKVSRPNYRNLNPFEYFVDKFTFLKGNPYLKPQYADSYTLNYTLLKMFNISMGYTFTDDAMVESMGQDSVANTTWIINENLAKQHNSFININAPVKIGQKWMMYNNLTAVRMFFEGPIAGDYIKQGSYMFQGNSTNNFKISPLWSTELSVNYMSPFVYNVYKLSTRWGVDFAITKNFKNERSSIKVAVNDIFKTNNTNLTTNFGAFDSKIRQYQDSRVFRLTYTYKFGNMKQNGQKRNTDNEETSRAL